MPTFREERVPFDIRHSIDTPGVPVELRYRVTTYRTGDNGIEAIVAQTIETDSQAPAPMVAQYLGQALASGRDEERRALTAERISTARAESLEAEVEKLRAELAFLKAELLKKQAATDGDSKAELKATNEDHG